MLNGSESLQLVLEYSIFYAGALFSHHNHNENSKRKAAGIFVIAQVFYKNIFKITEM